MTDSRRAQEKNRAHEAPPPQPQDRGKKKPKLEPPRVITYSGAEILEDLGPAHACSPFSGSVVGC